MRLRNTETQCDLDTFFDQSSFLRASAWWTSSSLSQLMLSRSGVVLTVKLSARVQLMLQSTIFGAAARLHHMPDILQHVS